MSDISIDLHLVWFWPGFGLVLVATWLLLARRARTGGALSGIILRAVLTAFAALVGGVASWVLAALVGGWF